MDWNDEQTISYIKMYLERSFSWYPIDSLYKNRNKRHYELIEIAVSFGIEKCNVEKKSVKCDTPQNNFNTENQYDFL